MGKSPKKPVSPAPKRNHHSNPRKERKQLRVKRRKAVLTDPPLLAQEPDIGEIRDAMDAARTSLRAALRAGFLVRLLRRTVRADFPDLMSDERLPGVRGNLWGFRTDPETGGIAELDIDLNHRYKTLMRHKRLWERFAAATGLSPDEPPDAALDGSAPVRPGSPAAAARDLLARSGGTSAGLSRIL